MFKGFFKVRKVTGYNSFIYKVGLFITTFSLIVFHVEDVKNRMYPTNIFLMLQNLPFPLQANLALSPTALLPASKNPEVTLQPAPLSASTSCRPPSPTLQPSPSSTEEKEATIFNNPPEGTPLPSINKVIQRCTLASES